MKTKFNHSQREDTYFLVSLYIYVFLVFVPLFRSFSVIAVQLPLFLLSFFLMLISVNNARGRKYAGTILFYSLILIFINFIFFYLQSNWNGATLLNRIGANYSLFVSSYPIILVCSGGLERINKERFSSVFLFFITLVCITTIVGTYKYWAPCRLLATSLNPELSIKYRREGIGGYSFIYYLVLVFPIMLRRLFERKTLLQLIIIAVSFFCVVRSEYTTAIFLMIISIFLCVFLHRGNMYGVAIISVVGVTILVNIENIIRAGVYLFQDLSMTITVRLQQMLDYLRNDSLGGDLLLRTDRYTISIDSFLQNPFFGGLLRQGSSNGGHSEILDLLGHSGLFGVFAIIFLVGWIMKHKVTRRLEKDAYVKTLYIIAAVLATINTFSAPELFFAVFVVPIIFNEQRAEVYE